MTTVITCRSSDASAPSLTGQAGSLLALLDACLVNGYGSQAAAGWTKPFANSGNVGCYKNSATDGTGQLLSVNDNGPGAGTYKEARATGYVTLSGIATGTGPFPTTGQVSGTGADYIRKSATADTTVRAWTLVADDTVFTLFTESGDVTNPVQASVFHFGDFFSYKSSDPLRTVMIGRNLENSAAGSQDMFGALPSSNQNILTVLIAGHYIAGTVAGAASSVACGKTVDMTLMGGFAGSASTGVTGTNGLAGASLGLGYNPNNPAEFSYPNAADGGLWVSAIRLHHNNGVRGYLKGLWGPLHHLPLNHNDTYTGTGAMSGKTFLVQNIMTNGGPNQVHIEISSTWS